MLKELRRMWIKILWGELFWEVTEEITEKRPELQKVFKSSTAHNAVFLVEILNREMSNQLMMS
jgi:hypothetical protein